MELRVLQYFLAVAREQSISAAAESLHLSQPTLSTQLKAMEDELGKQLLIRGSKGSRKVTLTEEGMILRKRAEEILQLVKKAEDEVTKSDETVAGDIFIGAAETDAFRFMVKAARALQNQYPLIHFHISSGDKTSVAESLDKGLIDFALVFGEIDTAKYNFLEVPVKDTWGVLMRQDAPLAKKADITAEDLWDKPLIISRQEFQGSAVQKFLKKSRDELNIVATYNLSYNGSLMIEEGVGYGICLDKIIKTSGESNLCFRPLTPVLEAGLHIVWKRYQVFSKAAEKYLQLLQQSSKPN